MKINFSEDWEKLTPQERQTLMSKVRDRLKEAIAEQLDEAMINGGNLRGRRERVFYARTPTVDASGTTAFNALKLEFTIDPDDDGRMFTDEQIEELRKAGIASDEMAAKLRRRSYPHGESSQAKAQRDAYARFTSAQNGFTGTTWTYTDPQRDPEWERKQAEATERLRRHAENMRNAHKQRTNPPADEPPLRVETHEEYDARIAREQAAAAEARAKAEAQAKAEAERRRRPIDPAEAARKHGLRDKVYEAPEGGIYGMGFEYGSPRQKDASRWTTSKGVYERMKRVATQQAQGDGYANVQIDVLPPALAARLAHYKDKRWTVATDYGLGGQYVIKSPRSTPHQSRIMAWRNPDTGKQCGLTFDDALAAWLALDAILQGA